MISDLTMRDQMAIIAAAGLISSFLTALLQYLFCTKRVPRLILIWRSTALGIFFVDLFVRGLSDDAIPLGYESLAVYANLALAQSAVMVFTYRRIIRGIDGGSRGDRCKSVTEEV